MSKKTIIISIICVVVIVAGVFAALNLKGGNDSDDLLAQLGMTDEDTEQLNETTLAFYFMGSEPKATREVLDSLESKLKGSLNVKLNFKFLNVPVGDGYINQVKSVIAAGNPCDAFYFSQGFANERTPVLLSSLVNDGLIKDITSLFPDNAKNYFSTFSKEEIRAASVNGKIYAVPYKIPTTQMRCAFVRDDLMRKNGIPEIKSYNDYEVYLKTIKANEPGVVPMNTFDTVIGLFAEANGYVILDYPMGLVYKWDDPSMKILAWEQTPEFRKGVETLADWYSKGYLKKGLFNTPSTDNVFASGEYGSFIMSLGSEFGINSTLLSQNISWKYDSYPLYPDQIAERNSPMLGAMVISEKSANADRVLKFIDWLQSSQENYDSLMYGIEGKHYVLNGDKVSIPQGINYADSCLNWSWRAPFRNIEYERIDNSANEEAMKEYREIIETKTKFPPHLGFVPDYTPVNTVRNFRGGSFVLLEQKLDGDIFTMADVDAYIKQQAGGGVDMMIAEVQRQLDEWKAKNND